MHITWKRVLWLSFVAGIGFSLGAGVVHFFGDFLVGLLALDQLGPWLSSRPA